MSKLSIEQLEKYISTLDRVGHKKEVNEAMVLQYLVATLRANAERDILMAEMAARFDELERNFQQEQTLHSRAYQTLVAEFRQLQRQQDELRASQTTIIAVVDSGVEKISEIVKKIESLSSSVDGLTES